MSRLCSGRVVRGALLLVLAAGCSEDRTSGPTEPTGKPSPTLEGLETPPPAPLAGAPQTPEVNRSDTVVIEGNTIRVASAAAAGGMTANLRRLRVMAPAASTAPINPMMAQVSSSGLVTIDFEGYTAATPITTQYSAYGVTLAGATVLVQNVNLNSPYPPRSGTSVVYDVTGGGGTVAVTFARPVSSAAGYVTSLQSVGLSCYDRGGALVGASTLPAANYLGAPFGIAPNYLVAVSGQNIMRCVFQGGTSGNTFTLDDLTFDPTAGGRLPPGASSRAAAGSYAANQSYMCARSGQLVPFGYFLTGWTRRDACNTPCPPGYVCLSGGMNAWSLKPFIDKPIGYRMSVCFYDSEVVLNEYPAAVGQHWRTDKIIAGGPQCSYKTGSITTIVAIYTGTQRDVTRDQ